MAPSPFARGVTLLLSHLLQMALKPFNFCITLSWIWIQYIIISLVLSLKVRIYFTDWIFPGNNHKLIQDVHSSLMPCHGSYFLHSGTPSMTSHVRLKCTLMKLTTSSSMVVSIGRSSIHNSKFHSLYKLWLWHFIEVLSNLFFSIELALKGLAMDLILYTSNSK